MARKPSATKSAPKTMQKPVEQSADAVAAGAETVQAVVKAGQEAAAKNYGQAVAATKEQVAKASNAVFKQYDDAAILGKDNVEAYVKSTAIIAKGMQSLSAEVMSYAQKSMEDSSKATQALFGATTLREMIDLQTELSRTSFDSWVAESARLTDLSVKVANEAIEPLQTQINVTVERFLKPAAA